MAKSNNGQDPLFAPTQSKPKHHNAKFCPLAIRERIVNALAAGDPHRAIARALRISNNTVAAVAEQEWRQVESRKARIAAQAERAATKAYERLNQKLDSEDDIPLNQLTIIAGVSVDKLLALRGDPGLIARIELEHTHTFNIFDLFNRYHQDAVKILEAKTEHPQPPLPPPGSPLPPDPAF
jgi:hypothetical protein